MKRIICLGDSNTYGYDPRSFLGGRYAAPWPALLAERLGCEVRNLGLNGREIPTGLWEMEALDRQLDGLLPADLLTVMLGSNDLLNQYRAAAELAADRMENYLEHLRSVFPELPVLLIAPPALGFDRGGAWELGRLYGALADRMAVGFADAAEWGLPLAFDGVHLTQEGHRLFAGRLARLLERGEGPA